MAKRGKYVFLLTLCLLIKGQAEPLLAQNNLVVNGGVEEFTGFPQFCSAAGNFTEPNFPGWHNNDLSVDALNTICDFCPIPCPAYVPENYVAIGSSDIPLIVGVNYLLPKSGNGYFGAAFASNYREAFNSVISNNARECAQGRFTNSLKKGQGYCVEFWVACSDVTNHSIDRLGIYFHKSQIPYTKIITNENDFNFLELTPQLDIYTGPILDTAGWTKITAEYVAEGGENYFILGNFQTDDEINFIKWQNNYDDEYWGKIAYLFFDDIAVYECDHIAIPDEEVLPPDIITPNGDGTNDVFEIYGLPPGSALIIYNRWGAEVYKSDNYHNNWQGESKTLGLETQVSEGVYFYVLTLPSGYRKAGTVTIVK